MRYQGIHIEKFAFLLGMTILGYGLYRESGAGLFLLIGVGILLLAPEEDE